MGKESASHRIAESLRAEILEGQRRPGERIRQELLAEEFGVSRLPIREALRILEADGLVTLVAHTGAWVSHMDLRQAEETYLIRERLDSLLLREAVKRYTDEDVERLAGIMADIEASETVTDYLHHDRRFHLESYRPAGMDSLYSLVENLWNSTHHYRRAYSELVGWEGLRMTHLEHRLLLETFKDRDAHEADRLMHSHIRKTRLELQRHPEIFEATEPGDD
ncbi:MAG: GntR family transcriptional regulator [Arthrobacter sp.]|nr:GntR family transcriptional regulator [Arthrobacter sp.]